MASLTGDALDSLVGAIVAKTGDAGFEAQVDKRFVETELELLKSKIDGYQKGELTAAEERGTLNGKIAQMDADQKDVFMYLNGELAKKTDEILELREAVEKMEDESMRALAESEAKLRDEKDRASVEMAMKMQELARVTTELDAYKRYEKEKAELEANLAQYQADLQSNLQAHATTISDLERKHVQEKDRLKKEMLYKLRETKANLLKMTDNQLDTTTKRTIAENEQMSSELAWQSKETEKLIRKNDKLASECVWTTRAAPA